jgi:hypothetical protein
VSCARSPGGRHRTGSRGTAREPGSRARD